MLEVNILFFSNCCQINFLIPLHKQVKISFKLLLLLITQIKALLAQLLVNFFWCHLYLVGKKPDFPFLVILTSSYFTTNTTCYQAENVFAHKAFYFFTYIFKIVLKIVLYCLFNRHGKYR